MRRMTAALAVSLVMATGVAKAAFDACRDYFPKQTPPSASVSPSQTRDLCMDRFAVLHSGESKAPVYVVERLNRARLLDAQDEERTDKFYEEARLPSAHRARLADYKGSGYDRGHIAPAATAMSCSPQFRFFDPALANLRRSFQPALAK